MLGHTRRGRGSRRLIVAISGLVLLALIAIGPAAWLSSAHSALPPADEPAPAPAANRTMPLGLRPVPVYRADGVVPQTFAGGDRLPSQAELDQAIDDAARSLSITQLPQIRAVLSETYTDGIRDNDRYPFAYPRLDPLVADALRRPADAQPGRRDQRPGRLVDLAGGASAGHRSTPRTTWPRPRRTRS